MQSPEKQRVLVYLFGSLGDTIMAIPALRAVRRHFGDAELVMLQNTQSADLVEASEVVPAGLIDRYLTYESSLSGQSKIREVFRLRNMLRRERFSAAVYVVISERPKLSVMRDKLFFRSCGIRNLIGFHAFSNEELFPVEKNGHPAATQNEAVRKLVRLERDGIDIDFASAFQHPLLIISSAESEAIENWLAHRRKDPVSRLIAVAPGCKTKANQWPVEHFIALLRRLTADGNYEIIIVGGKSDAEAGEKIIDALNAGINAAGIFSVRESAALLSFCDLHIGLDTGTTHLAAAVNTRCFAIYGERNNPGHWYPIGDNHCIVYHRVECAGCRLFTCPLPDHPCILGISADAAWTKLEAFMKKIRTSQAAATEAVAV